MAFGLLERVARKREGLGFQSSEKQAFFKVLVEIGEARKKRSPVLADYQIDWNLVAIGITSKHLKKLKPAIRGLAKSMRSYGLKTLLLVEREGQVQDLPENIEVVVSGRVTANWLRDHYFPTAEGLIEQPGRRLSSKLTPFILKRASNLRLESYRKISFLRGGDVVVGGNEVFVGGITWNCLVDKLGIEKSEKFLKAFLGRKKVIVIPWGLIHEEDIPISFVDLDSCLTVLGEKIILVGNEVNRRKNPQAYNYLQKTAEVLMKNGFDVRRLPFDSKGQKTYNNSLIHGFKKIAFVPQYGERDELYSQAAEIYRQAGYTPISIPFSSSFSRSNFGQLRCLTLPLPSF